MKRYLFIISCLLLCLIARSQSTYTYHCWFDQDIEHKQSGALGNGQLLLDASDIGPGLHTLYVMLKGDELTTAENYMFYKAPVADVINTDAVKFQYWFDEDIEHLQELPFGTGQFLLNASALEDGPHVINIMLKNGMLTSTESYGFVKGEQWHIISARVNPKGSGVVTGVGFYEEGQECTLAATANQYYAFVNWTENDNTVSTNASYNFTVEEDRDLTANFDYTPLGDFTYMSPTDNYPVASLPLVFSWSAVSNARNYDLYLWNANEAMPQEPYVSGLSSGFYRCPSLPNHQTYQWFVRAYNPYNTVTSSVRSFTLDVEPTINASLGNINFGEVALNHTASTALNIEGVALEDSLQIQLVGEDASMFSFATASGWDDYTGGSVVVSFTPTVAQYDFHATLVVSSGTLTQSIALLGGVADTFVFNTFVDEDVYAMNTAIPIHGTVRDNANVPAAHVDVEIGVFVMGMKRTLQATTDANGAFSATFEPMPSESGYYTVNSGRLGNNSTAVHDDFNIPGLSVITDGYILCIVTQDQPKTDSILIRNKSNLPLNNIQVSTLSVPEGCAFTFSPLSLGGLEEDYLVYTVTGSTLTQGNYYEEVRLKATSSEGAETIITLWYYCMEARGALDVEPNSIATTMTKGQSKIVDVMLTNNGTGATGNITIDLPNVEWMSVVGSETLPSLAVNDTAYFSLRFSPDDDVTLVQYTGNIVINSDRGDAVDLPYTITAVSDSTGMLVIDVTDDYTWNTNNGNGPHLEGAEVTLKGYYSLETVAQGYTDANGIFQVEDLPEGYYRLQVTADHHSQYDNTILITAGDNRQNIYLQYQSITYSWDVVPTEIEDEYTYELNVVYETNVPVPVITIEQSGIHDLEYGESDNFNLVITNHGLVSAFDTHIYFTESDEYTFVPLYDVIDTLPALTTVVVPGTYYRTEGRLRADENCDIHCWTISIYYCNNNGSWTSLLKNRSLPFGLGEYELCNPIGDGEGGLIPGYNTNISYGGGVETVIPIPPQVEMPPVTKKEFCTPCLDALVSVLADLIDTNIPGCLALNVLTHGGLAIIHGGGFDLSRFIKDEVACFFTGTIGAIYNLGVSLKDAWDLINCVKFDFNNSKNNMDNLQNAIDGLYYSSVFVYNELMFVKSVFVEDVWDNEENILEFLDEFDVLVNSDNGMISESDAVNLATTFVGTSVTYDDIISFVNRWNRSYEYWSSGYYVDSDLPQGYNTDFIQIDSTVVNYMISIENYYILEGYSGMQEVYEESKGNADSIINNASQSSVCASVTVQFSQKMTMTREAFEGTFTVHNGHDENAMGSIGLNFVVKDEDGNDCTNLFQINTTSLHNITGIDGDGSLEAGLDGVAKIMFIPTRQAAQTEPKVYYFGGTFSFIDPYTSDELVYDLYPVDLTVHPSPDLYVDYFMQRDILGDDALTIDKVEPSVPAELGVIINNKGAGIAKNVTLETAEPVIVDNEKGLAIDFAMYGASFNGNEAQLGLMSIPFGNIGSGHTAVGEWLFTSSLLGHFVSYEAHVIHNNSYGNPNLSLVSYLDIHELIHPIRVYGDLEDGINDFLVNDVPDYYDTPDSIYFSHGGRTAVGLFDDIRFDHYVTPRDTIVRLTVNPSRIGWNYGVVDDPGMDGYELVACTRNTDSQIIPMNNIWQTYVTLHDASDPIYENKLHFVDTLPNNRQEYTYILVYTKKKDLLKVEEIVGIPESAFIDYPLESFSVKFSKPIVDSTFAYEDMLLKCNNGSNLMNSMVEITKVDDDLYDVNIAGLTHQTGYYVLNVNTLNISDAQGYNGYEGKQATWIQVLDGDVFVHIDSDQTICDNETFELLTSVVVGEYNALQWKRDGIAITGANSLDYQTSQPGVYSLTVTFANGDELTSNEVTLDILESPIVHIQVDTIIDNGISFRLTATGAENYEWSTGEISTSIIVSPVDSTTYSVVGTNSYGCSDTDAVTVFGGIGVDEHQVTSSVTIFPNPVRDKLFVRASSPVCKMEIFTVLGTLVCERSNGSETMEIDVQNLSSGLYFVRLLTENEVVTVRFIKN